MIEGKEREAVAEAKKRVPARLRSNQSKMVGQLIEKPFAEIADSSTKQMDQYSGMVGGVGSSVDSFTTDEAAATQTNLKVQSPRCAPSKTASQ